MIKNVTQRGRGLQHVVHRAEQGGVRGAVDRRMRHRGGEETHIVPAVLGHPVAGHLEHLLGFVDPHDRPRGADLVLQQRQAQPSTAPHVEDRVAAPGRQPIDQQFAPVAKGLSPLVVAAGLAAVGLGRCGVLLYEVACWRGAGQLSVRCC